MKKYFLFFLIIILLSACAVNKERMRTTTGKLEDILGTFKLSSGIEGKLLTWKDSRAPVKWYEEAIPSPIWPVYPGEMISESMVGREIRLTYQVAETIPNDMGVEEILAILIKKIEVLDKKK